MFRCTFLHLAVRKTKSGMHHLIMHMFPSSGLLFQRVDTAATSSSWGISSSSLAVSYIIDSRTKVYQLIVTDFAPCKIKNLILAPHNSFWCRVCKHIPAQSQEAKPCSQDKLPCICLRSSDASFDMSCAAVWQHLR